MTLDAAIQHAKEVAVTQNNQDCIKCAEEHEQLAEWLEELKEYQQLEEQGRLIKLPCKIGDDVWFVPSQANYKLNILSHHSKANRVYHQKVAKITFSMNGWYLECDKDLEYATDHILVDKMYKETWFLTKKRCRGKN